MWYERILSRHRTGERPVLSCRRRGIAEHFRDQLEMLRDVRLDGEIVDQLIVQMRAFVRLAEKGDSQVGIEIQFADIFGQITAYATGTPINVVNPAVLLHAGARPVPDR